jgi:hypothetical protein
MKIKITGKLKNMSRTEFEDMMQYYGRLLLGKRLTKKIFVEVRFTKLSKRVGYAHSTDYRSRRHRDFEIVLRDDLSYDEIVSIAAHEMAHVRQLALGDLTCLYENIWDWQGMKFKLTKKTYPFTPWEKDARWSEAWLRYFYNQYKEQYGSPQMHRV